jgi:hypothetical protein
MIYALPFRTFSEAAAYNLEVEVSCICGRRVVIDGGADYFRGRPIMGARFKCTTILPDGAPCKAQPSVYIRKRGRQGWTLGDHSRAIQAHQAQGPIDAKPCTFGQLVAHCEVAHLYDQGCVPSYTIGMVEFDEPPWNRFLDKPWGQFICPGCRKPLMMHAAYGPGTPGTERFNKKIA